jgi:hypothetical protein
VVFGIVENTFEGNPIRGDAYATGWLPLKSVSDRSERALAAQFWALARSSVASPMPLQATGLERSCPTRPSASPGKPSIDASQPGQKTLKRWKELEGCDPLRSTRGCL